VTEPEGEEQFEGAAGGGAAAPPPAEQEPVESEPVEREPVESQPVEPEPAEREPVESQPVEPEPAEREPVEPEPVDEPVESQPAGSESEEATVDVAAAMGAILDEAAAYQATVAEDDEEAPASSLPDLTDDATLHAALESLLLVVDSPAEDELLATTLDQPVKRIREALEALSARYTEACSGIDLRRVGDGWRLHTRDTYAPYVEKLLLDGQRAKLTRAALETLAVIAYRQPVTRSRVAAVRGVNVDGVIRTLVTRGLIEETGNDPDTGGILYRTTELFLERLGLSSLQDLPPIAPLLPEVDAIDDVG
jgi:segregation and condensation protein B